MNKPRLLIKISGGQLKDSKNCTFYEKEPLFHLVEQIIQLSKNYQVGIVLGGGNIWRGKENTLSEISDVQSDYVGMLATLINGIILRDILTFHGQESVLFSAIHCGKISSEINPVLVNDALNSGKIAIFSGGTGLPFVTTDTAATIRAIEIRAKIVLIGKEGVKGVYDKDPKLNSDAQFFPKLTYDDIISKDLKVMDPTTLTLAKEHKLKFLIFNQASRNAFVDAIDNKIELTEISQ